MKSQLILGISVAIFLGGCASSLHRGVVAMKIDNTTAHVGLNKDEAKPGDHVILYGSACQGSKEVRSCKKVEKGHGTVSEILGENYVAVKFDDGVGFSEGDFVEKHSH